MMFPFSPPGASGGIPSMDLLQRILQMQRMQGGGGYGTQNRPPQQPQQPFNWLDPMASLGQRFQQGPAMDNSGLSSLWSKQIGQSVQGPGGWNTTTYGAQSPLGGLLGKFGNMFQ